MISTGVRIVITPHIHRYIEPEAQRAVALLARLQESQGLQERCEEERTLGQDFADEAQEWVTLAGNLSDKVNTLTAEAEQIAQLREVTKSTAMSVMRVGFICCIPQTQCLL